MERVNGNRRKIESREGRMGGDGEERRENEEGGGKAYRQNEGIDWREG